MVKVWSYLPWKAIWQLDRTVRNFFLEDKFLLWLASAFDLFLLPAWNSWQNSNFPRTIVSIVWWATEKSTNISLEYLRSYQNNYTCPCTPPHPGWSTQPMTSWLWLKYRVHSCHSSEEVCHWKFPTCYSFCPYHPLVFKIVTLSSQSLTPQSPIPP